MLVLLSGAGLLAFAVVDLWGAVRDADEVAREEATRKAEAIAEELEGLLTSHFFDRAAHRFRLERGSLVIPEDVGWLENAPAPYSEARLPNEAWSKLRAARRLEFAATDASGARKAMAEAMTVAGLSEADRRFLTVESMWQAVRAGETDTASRLFKRLCENPPKDAAMAASVWLRARQVGAKPPQQVEQRALTLPESARHGLVDALDYRKVDAKRAVLLRIRNQLRRLDHGRTLETPPQRYERYFDHEVILLRQGNGFLDGAVIPAAMLEEWNPQVRVHALASQPPAVPVTQSISVEPKITPAPIWANPILLIVLLLLLAVCFGAGLFFSFRAILRESAAMRSRADFLTSVTHELKTPLSSIRLLSEMLEEGRVRGEDKKSEYYRLLAGESARLTVLIENVLDLGRMERGERAYDRRPQNVDEVVAEAAKVFEPIANRDGLDLTVELDADEREARIDRGALVQALLNVMDNARKYAMAGGKLEVKSRGANGTYHLSVRDHGPGIDATDREAIFDRFSRGRAQKDGSIAGVGLGLYLARTILRAHDGELACVEPDGGGAEFVFSLPLSDSSEDSS